MHTCTVSEQDPSSTTKNNSAPLLAALAVLSHPFTTAFCPTKPLPLANSSRTLTRFLVNLAGARSSRLAPCTTDALEVRSPLSPTIGRGRSPASPTPPPPPPAALPPPSPEGSALVPAPAAPAPAASAAGAFAVCFFFCCCCCFCFFFPLLLLLPLLTLASSPTPLVEVAGEKAPLWVTVRYQRSTCGIPARSRGPSTPRPPSQGSRTSPAAQASATSAMVTRWPTRKVLGGGEWKGEAFRRYRRGQGTRDRGHGKRKRGRGIVGGSQQTRRRGGGGGAADPSPRIIFEQSLEPPGKVKTQRTKTTQQTEKKTEKTTKNKNVYKSIVQNNPRT